MEVSRSFAILVFTALASSNLSFAQIGLSQLVVTQHGIFQDCNIAVKYRDTTLVGGLDAAFEGYSKKNYQI
mgnify:CR=1 FL=1